MLSEAVRIDETETPESDSGVRIRRDPDGVAWAKSWFQNMPEPWRMEYEKLKARRVSNK